MSARSLVRRAMAPLALSAVGLVATTAPASAQISHPSVGGALWYQLYSFDAASTMGVDKLALASLHFTASTPVVDRVALGVSGAWAKGTLTRTDGTTLDISGLTDTQVSLTFTPNEFVNVSGIFLAPTGKETQTLEESVVAGSMASDLFPFKVANWGSGGGMGVNASMAHPVGNVGMGLSVGVIAGREFKPLDSNAFAYRPGMLVRVVGAVDGTVGEASKASLRVTYHHYGQDQIDGNNLFQSGNRFQAMASIAFPMGGRSSGIAYGGMTHRQRSTLLEGLPFAQEFPSQNLFLLGGGLRVPVGGRVLQPDAELRVLRRSDSAGQGIDLGVGASLEFRSGRSTFAPSARLHIGQLEMRQGSKGNLFGFELGLSARVGGGS